MLVPLESSGCGLVTAGSPPAGMLRERLQGECIREQLQFFLGSLLGTFYRDLEKRGY